ncbi:MAG: ribonuclease P protein component [Methylococcales bacterium]|nr:ribonuclease P protein component [Methylococcales bacterium]MCX7076219.1 ribonuclease P protein component [Methylococcales bacterium]
MTKIDFSFSQQLRLKKPAEYKKVFTNPTKSSDMYFTLLAVKNEFDYPRLGLVIAKKNIRKAVHRNRIKRIIRDNFRCHRHNVCNIDIVVMARREAQDVTSFLLQKSLEKHWLKLVTRCNSYSSPL